MKKLTVGLGLFENKEFWEISCFSGCCGSCTGWEMEIGVVEGLVSATWLPKRPVVFDWLKVGAKLGVVSWDWEKNPLFWAKNGAGAGFGSYLLGRENRFLLLSLLNSEEELFANKLCWFPLDWADNSGFSSGLFSSFFLKKSLENDFTSTCCGFAALKSKVPSFERLKIVLGSDCWEYDLFSSCLLKTGKSGVEEVLMSSFAAKLLTIGLKIDVIWSLLESNNSVFFYYSFGLFRLKILVPNVLPPNNELGCVLLEGFYVDSFFPKILNVGSAYFWTAASFWKMLTG